MNLSPFRLMLHLVFIFVLISCTQPQPKLDLSVINENITDACKQVDLLLLISEEQNKIPRTVNKDGEIHFCKSRFDWTAGFFPGICWQLYKTTGNVKYKKSAKYFQEKLKQHRFLTSNHDLGFVFNSSYVKAYLSTGYDEYKTIALDAANSLTQRFNPNIGCLQSWNTNKGWMSKRGWQFPVIIDNMMNLELLFEASKLSGDSTYRKIAVSHANKTLKNHFRPDYSSFHVVDYNIETGAIRSKETAQGYAHESAWSRGQAWGLYGFTMCYRYTQDTAYLELAEKIASYILSHPNLPEDKIPYWDFNAPNIPNEPRDASAAAIIASALLELNNYSQKDYREAAKEIIKSLISKTYKAKLGTNNNFMLKHSVGSIPHKAEIDVPLIYADYYYLESLIRLKNSFR